MLTHKTYDESVAAYLENGRADNMSPVSLRNYERRLRMYGDFCREKDLSPDEPAAAQAWKLALHENGLQNSSVAVYLREVRNFFRWAVASPLSAIGENPVTDGMIPKTKRRPYEKVLTVEEIVSVLAGKKQKTARRSPLWVRNNAMAILFLETAIRTSELTALTLDDLDWENSLLTVRHGKGDKYRVTMFPAMAQEALREYLASGLRPSNLPTDAPLFGSFSEKCPVWHALARTQASDLISRHIRAVTGRDDVRPHALRHAAASAMLMQEAPTEDIQQVLGHSNIQTTERYIALLRPDAAAKRMTNIFAGLENAARQDGQNPNLESPV